MNRLKALRTGLLSRTSNYCSTYDLLRVRKVYLCKTVLQTFKLHDLAAHVVQYVVETDARREFGEDKSLLPP